MPRTGRPKIEINQQVFESLCRLSCTKAEIVSVLDISEPTLWRWIKRTYRGQTFETIHRQKAEGGKVGIRRAQIKLAESGNATMLIWLGKQLLNQRDKQDLDIKITDEREVAEAVISDYLERNPGQTRAEAVEFARHHVPEVEKLASELVQ